MQFQERNILGISISGITHQLDIHFFNFQIVSRGKEAKLGPIRLNPKYNLVFGLNP